MFEIEKFRDRVQLICRELRLQRLELVGSAARSDFSEQSDIDVLVSFSGDDRLFDRYFELKERLEKVFERPVDVIEERAVKNPFFKKTIERDRVTLYGT
ncbi:MAG TPA: nucleotidyltransferase domain-containing protein [Pyrinomonadaceae bacterium]|nr:nucleotidyltransferase domain-containing protein [Chloracidobacterium sp.]MBP9107999.1 nucleotidyltransferase domain-containing protein [Pyrinomonadaceae bacterium]MBK7801686.1 nucleotidyltransferase domain-containing protein [Chloracidobacterium sp.]MBK9437004.1 nucleotidyltransferase domain-containing protein [Chloracidobacterium sp.]MBK9768134.1 nucleotidyltransferase domain-containing protein [Chloracidobacterium sp.]